jgi:NACHT domain
MRKRINGMAPGLDYAGSDDVGGLNAGVGTDEDAWLWAPPDAQPGSLPVTTKLPRLPIEDLTWENTERLFLRLLERQGDVQWAKLYGRRGQYQEGIDAYARLTRKGDDKSEQALTQAAEGRRSWKPYAVLQSRRVRSLSPSDIVGAVEDFLEGSWGPETGTFYFATSYDLTDTKLDEALRQAAERLAEVKIDLVPWGVEQVSALLRGEPELVDDFFGRAWVEAFCGAEALTTLQPRLPFRDLRDLRQQLTGLYAAVFESQNAIRRQINEVPYASESAEEPSPVDRFVVVDVAPRPSGALGDVAWLMQGRLAFEATEDARQATDRTRESGGLSLNLGAGSAGPVASSIPGAATTAAAGAAGQHHVVSSAHRGRPRRTLRPVRSLLDLDSFSTADSAFREAGDEWLSRGTRNLLVGDPGSGKSSLLRFVALDLLSPAPQSTALQHMHGGRLPVWLPFGFLCRHLDEAQGHSLHTAIRTWLESRAAGHIWPLVERALTDDRLLLLIDGIDEWTSRESANIALDSIETFLGRTEAAAFLSSRPYAVARLMSALTWRRADLIVLDDVQRRRMAAQYLAPSDRLPNGYSSHSPSAASGSNRETGTEQPPGDAVWHRSNVEPFLAELTAVPELSTLARTPLFLALLATTWRGEPLPPQRYNLYRAIVDLLIVRHPQMRRRSSRASDLPLNDRDFKTTIEAVAYALRMAGHNGPIPSRRLRQLLQEALCDEEVGGYPLAEARLMADAALQMAEDEFGMLVPQGADHVGFVHRVVFDQLAGQRLAKLEISAQIEVFSSRHIDPGWSEVLLSALTAQPNPPTVARILDAVLAEGGRSSAQWPWDVLRKQSALELLAAAIAAEVDLSPRKLTDYLDLLVKQVETSPSLEHRAAVITSLVKACAHADLGRRLLPTFKRWLDATRPFPTSALFALRDLPIDDTRARTLLLRGMLSDYGEVRANAATAYAHRFGQPREPIPSSLRAPARYVRAETSQDAIDPLVDLIQDGPTVTAQAAALLAMGLGWSEELETREHLLWGRNQPRLAVRTTALYLTIKNAPEVPLRGVLERDEVDWVLSLVRNERYSYEHSWTTMTYDLVEKAVAQCDTEQRAELSAFALETLRTNGRTGGNRSLCWWLACTVLADDERLRDWVVAELNSETDRPLILYNLDLIPEEWRRHADMEQALAAYVENEILNDVVSSAVQLSRSLSGDQALAPLLRALDGYRPWAAAARLVEEFGEEPEARAALLSRLADDTVAARFSPVALDVMGIEAGFERLYSLLRSSLQPDSQLRGTDQVVLAGAVATAWAQIRDTATGVVDNPAVNVKTQSGAQASPREQALRVLAKVDENQVCAACTSVSTSGLGWHIADIIYTWPDITVEYALRALSDNRHVTQGLDDTIHATVLRAHTERPGPESDRVVDTALDLLLCLEPELREVLTHELCSIGLAPEELLDVLSAWQRDRDDGVRRTVVVGVTQTLIRAQRIAHALGATTEIPELQTWRASVREQLCSYGPSMEENRRNAWIAMLLLDDLDLIQGLKESIGEPVEPGVRLSDLYDMPDELLVELIVDKWDELDARFGDQLLSRLSGGRHNKSRDDRLGVTQVVQSLAIAADKHPAVARLVAEHLDIANVIPAGLAVGTDASPSTEADSALRRAQDDLRVSLGVVARQKRDLGEDPQIVQRLLEACDLAATGTPPRFRQVRQWALPHLLDDRWRELSDQRLENLVVQRSPRWWDSDKAWVSPQASVRRTVWTLLRPTDHQTKMWLTGLGRWFAGSKQEEQPSSWLEVSALCLGATPAEDLPAIVGRMFYPARTEYLDDSFWELTAPLLYRLRHDTAAVEALRVSLSGDPVTETSPFFAPSDPETDPLPGQGPDAGPGILDRTARHLDALARRIFVTTLALKHSGHLAADDLQTAVHTLRRADPRVIVIDPFASQAGPLHAVGSALPQH